MAIEHLTYDSFKEKVFDFDTHNSWNFIGDKPCVIDFYADWCEPCKELDPVFDEIDQELGDKLTVYKINTDDEDELANVFGIQSIPFLLFVPMEGDPQMETGALPKEIILEAIEDVCGVK